MIDVLLGQALISRRNSKDKSFKDTTLAERHSEGCVPGHHTIQNERTALRPSLPDLACPKAEISKKQYTYGPRSVVFRPPTLSKSIYPTPRAHVEPRSISRTDVFVVIWFVSSINISLRSCI